MVNREKLADWIDKVVLFSILVVAFQLPISKCIIEFFSALSIFLYFIRMIYLRQDIRKNWIYFFLVLYAGMCFLSVFFSTNLMISCRNFVGKTMQDVLFVFVIAGTLNNERRLKIFALVFLSASFVLGVDGIYQYITHKEFIRSRPYYLPRIYATFPSPNDFGCYLVSIIPFALVAVFIKTLKMVFRVAALGLFLLLFVCVVLTVSRGAWISLIVEAIFFSIWLWPAGTLLLTISALLIFSRNLFNSLLKYRLSNFFVFSDNGAIDRIAIWIAGGKMFLSSPWVGVGLGTFMFNFDKFLSKKVIFTVPYAHNCYLQMACETGILGLVSFLSILACLFYYGIKYLIRKKRTFSWFMLLATLVSILGYCIQMGVDTAFYSLDLGLLFWLLLGLGIAAIKSLETESVDK